MKTVDLGSIVLDAGDHTGPDDGMCLMEAVAWIAGEPWSDRPACVSVGLAAFGRALNDTLPDNLRQRLVPLIPAPIGTAGDGLDEARGYLALDWLVRTWTPAWLDVAGLSAQASMLRDLRRIVDVSAARAARPVVREAQAKTHAAWAAARDAAWDAAWDAAGAAVWDAVWDAAWDAARIAVWDAAGVAVWDAARDAAWSAARNAVWNAAWDAAGAAVWDAVWDAAWDAARNAARDALAPTATQLQESAIDLFARMIRPGGDA